MIEFSQSTLLDILPDSIRNDEENKAMAAAVTVMLQRIFKDTGQLNPTLPIPEEWLDTIAAEEHVDFYSSSFSPDKKRELIDKSDRVHKKKGTPYAVEEISTIVLPKSKISEWNEYGGEPFFFRLETEESLTTDINVSEITRMVEATKNERSWLENITVDRKLDLGLNFGGVISDYRIMDILLPPFQLPDFTKNTLFGGVIAKWNTTQIEMPPWPAASHVEVHKQIGAAFSCWAQTTIYPEVSELGKL